MSSKYSRLSIDIPVAALPGGDDQQACPTPSRQLGLARSRARFMSERDLSGGPDISPSSGSVISGGNGMDGGSGKSMTCGGLVGLDVGRLGGCGRSCA